MLLFNVNLSSCMSSSCAPPHPMWCVDVSCYVLPPTSSMGLPSCCWCVSGSSVHSVCWGNSYDFWGFYVICFDIFVTISIQHCFSLGNAAHPPTVPENPHASCTQAYKHTEISAHPPASFPPSAIHTIHANPAKPPTHSNPTHPLIPPSFFRFSLGQFNHQKQIWDFRGTRYRCLF